ncbi:unnamed protein product [Caenorhabditis bovis]|uniref:tRNA (34-2'-O)-methyltransferase regulator WDR6 n=1 Tax=Caenorhabditis bovis TaxID=2654633 RepID=A0A8S1FE34_9PELO|nr:unnamed protein product [Caenorhabditis bovis]
MRFNENLLQDLLAELALNRKNVIVVTSRNTLLQYRTNDLTLEKSIQCDYQATSICSLILNDSNALKVFFGSVLGDLIQWDVTKTGKESVKMFYGHKGMIFAIASDRSKIFTTSDDRTLRMWSTDNMENGPICSAFGHTARPFAIYVDSKHYKIFTGGIEQAIFVWSYTNSELYLNRKIFLSIGVFRKITPIDENFLAIGSRGGNLMIVNVGDASGAEELIPDEIRNFGFLDEKLVILNEKNVPKISTIPAVFTVIRISQSIEVLVLGSSHGELLYVNLTNPDVHVAKYCLKVIDLHEDSFWLRSLQKPDEGRVVCVKISQIEDEIVFFVSYSSAIIEIFKMEDNELKSAGRIDLPQELGIGAKVK